MTPQDPQAAATKQDIAMLMDEMGKMHMSIERIHNDTANWKDEMKQDMRDWKKEIVHEFHVVAEDIRHDMLGAHKDKIGVLSDRSDRHEKRITKLEQHTGLIAA